jgi:hypothetical protein
MVSDLEKAYIAGLFDGEGSTYIQKAVTQKKGRWFQPFATFTNNDVLVLEYLKEIYGETLQMSRAGRVIICVLPIPVRYSEYFLTSTRTS